MFKKIILQRTFWQKFLSSGYFMLIIISILKKTHPSRLWTTGTSVPKSRPSLDFFLPAPMKIFYMLASFGREKQSPMKWEWCIYNSWIDSSPGFLARMTAACRQTTTTCACNTSKNKNEKKKILIKQSFPEWIYTSCRIFSFVLFCNISYNTDMIGEWLFKTRVPTLLGECNWPFM